MKLYVKTVSRNLLDGLDDRFESLTIFNFQTGTSKYTLGKKYNDTIASNDASWIRVYLKDGMYYDFITSSLIYFITEKSFIIMCNDDAEFVDIPYIAKLITQSQIDEEQIDQVTADDALAFYYDKTKIHFKETEEKLKDLYNVASQVASTSRLQLQDTYHFGKAKLEKSYILDIMIRQIIKENRDKILSLL